MRNVFFGLCLLAFGCGTNIQNDHREELNKAVVKRYGEGNRLMRGDDSISQGIIDRYCLAEHKDEDDVEPEPDDKYKSGWRPWLCGPFPSTYTMSQNPDGTYHIRYEPENLDADGKPIDKWEHKGVKNVEMKEFMDEFNKVRQDHTRDDGPNT